MENDKFIHKNIKDYILYVGLAISTLQVIILEAYKDIYLLQKVSLDF